MSRRIALGVEYDGTNYHGWQGQKNDPVPTIQQQLEHSISRIANHTISIVCAGRTDRGVHALEQVLHFETTANRKLDNWILGVNSILPPDIRVLWAKEVDLSFNARKSAIYRTYNYFIYNSKIKPSLFRNYITWQHKHLDLNSMQQASNCWLGEHDFTSFKGRDCQSKTSYRKIYDIKILKENNLITISITANAFLQRMVRNMVGVLVKIGQGDADVDWSKEVLLAKNRNIASVYSPPEGLYLAKVGYPMHFNLPIAHGSSYFSLLKREFL